ncbi:MAG: hypothetical protein QXL94_06145 [Candidatus Parvarchaeum sp.]
MVTYTDIIMIMAIVGLGTYLFFILTYGLDRIERSDLYTKHKKPTPSQYCDCHVKVLDKYTKIYDWRDEEDD